MNSRSRKGQFSPIAPSEKTSNTGSRGITTVSFRGDGVVDDGIIHFDEFQRSALIWNNRNSIFSQMYLGTSPSTQKNTRRYLRVVISYIEAVESTRGKFPEAGDLGFTDTSGFPAFVKNLNSKHNHVQFFNRLLRVIGAPASALIPNPYAPKESGIKKSLEFPSLRGALTRAKLEADLIRDRVRTFHKLRSMGGDPRAEKSGWDKTENRLWFLEHVIGLHAPAFMDLKGNALLSPSLHEFNKHPGAPIAAASSTQKFGGASAEVGYASHFRWFFPDPNDLVPFIALLLLRTPLNLTAIADAQVVEGDWHTPYQFNMSQKSDEFVYVWFNKVRGRRGPKDDPKAVYAVSPKTPRSFPYQVRKFLEELTTELRLELKRQIANLAADPAGSAPELSRLRSMENDLFLYRSKQGINSLRNVMRKGTTPGFLSIGLKAYGLSVGNMRGNNLAFTYNFSGQNLASISYLAMHRDRNMAILYARRDAAVRKTEELFRNIFNNSMNLISADIFDVENLKLLLEAQNLDVEQVGNLLDAETLTRWGNRCANPLSPPKGFSQGTSPGQPCREQNCIDGCPLARWFSDSKKLVADYIIVLKKKLFSLTHSVAFASSLASRIARLEHISHTLQEVPS